jgi:hypothetical protein
LLYQFKRAPPGIQRAVVLQTTQVRSPDEDDYKKLTRCMKNLRGTLNLPLRMEVDDIHLVKWWMDPSFTAIHPNMKSHTRATMLVGRGLAYSKSTRQKLNTKSSIEAKLVGIDDIMLQVI